MRLDWLARGLDDVPTFDDWLGPFEAARLATMRFPKRRAEYRLRRWAGKTSVAMMLGLPLDPDALGRVEVRTVPGGAPVAYLDGAPAPVRVSLTDRSGWAVSTVSTGMAAFGCDLELVEPRSAAFVADWLTPTEQAVVNAVTGVERDVLANLTWSAKESALKVLKTGLRRDTRSVAVSLDDAAQAGWHQLHVTATEGPVYSGWWRRYGAFVLSVVTDRELAPPGSLDDPPRLTTAQPREAPIGPPLPPA